MDDENKKEEGAEESEEVKNTEPEKDENFEEKPEEVEGSEAV